MKWQHHSFTPENKRWKITFVAGFILIGLSLMAAGVSTLYYRSSLQPVDTGGQAKEITIAEGTSMSEIASQLKEEGLIREGWAFQWYVQLRGGEKYLLAGTYVFSPSQSTPSIVSQLTHGKVTSKLIVILPGQRLDQVRRSLVDQGFSEASVDSALEPTQYENLPLLADKPKGASLEGYLYPESFERGADTKASDIVRLSLAQMDRHLTPDIKQRFTTLGLSVHQGIILASIIEKEVVTPADQRQVAQVFLKRLSIDMPLGADATYVYAAKIAGDTPSSDYESPYNTRKYTGLPPGPISNVDEPVLRALAEPASGDYLFFVSGDDGTTHFSKTFDEHLQNTEKYCKKLCQ